MGKISAFDHKVSVKFGSYVSEVIFLKGFVLLYKRAKNISICVKICISDYFKQKVKFAMQLKQT